MDVTLGRDEFERFKELFVLHAEGILNKGSEACRKAMRGFQLTVSDVSTNECIKALIYIKDAEGLGNLLALFINGRLASAQKEAIFTKDFYSNLICPEEYMIDDTTHRLSPEDQLQLTKFVQLVFQYLLRVHILLKHEDLIECLKSVKSSKLKLVITVAKLHAPELASEEELVADALFKILCTNKKVRDAFVMSYSNLPMKSRHLSSLCLGEQIELVQKLVSKTSRYYIYV